MLLLREDPGVVGPAPEDLRPDPVAPARAVAPAASPVRALVDAAEVPACHVAGGALPERMNAGRHQVTDADDDNNNYRYHAGDSLLTRTRTTRTATPPDTRPGTATPSAG